MLDKFRLIIFAAVVALAAIAGAWLNGARWEKKFLTLEKENAAALAKAQEQARKIEQDWVKTHDDLKGKHDEETKRYKNEITNLRNSLRTGSIRLSVPAASASAMSGNSTTGHSKERCFIDAGTAERLVDITERGDDAIRELNLCIDKYNALRK